MLPEKPVQSNTSDPEWLAYELELVSQWANLPGRNGLKTDSTISQYEKTLGGLLDSAGKPFCQMTVADIAEYVDVINSANRLAKITKFLQWAHAWGHIKGDLAYAYEKRNPHIVKMQKVWDEPTQALYDRWIASRTFRTPDAEHDYRSAIMRVWSYFSGPLHTLTTDDVKGMNITARDRGLAERFTKWLARQPITVATPDVPVPDSSETIARMQAELAVLTNTVETLTANSNIWVKFDVVGKLRTIEARQEGMQSDIPTLAERIQRLESAINPTNSDAWRSLAKRMGHLESLWGRQLDERLANLDRRHAEVVAVVTAIARVMHRLVKACYTGTSPIHPLDGKDLRYLSDVMTDFWGRTRHWLDTSDPVRDAPVPMHPPRNGVAPALVDSDSRNGVAHAPSDDDKWPE